MKRGGVILTDEKGWGDFKLMEGGGVILDK